MAWVPAIGHFACDNMLDRSTEAAAFAVQETNDRQKDPYLLHGEPSPHPLCVVLLLLLLFLHRPARAASPSSSSCKPLRSMRWRWVDGMDLTEQK